MRNDDADPQARALRQLGLDADDLAAWKGSGQPREAFDDWVTDRIARRPSGASARRVYGADDAHDFARRAILDALRLGPGDRLLDIGCGGGQLLQDALGSGAAAVGLDHSAEMVELAGTRAPGARVVLGSAETLPFADHTFSAVSMSVIFFFLPDPVAVLRECRRVLQPGGRVAVYTIAQELRGTAAAPEPIASRGRFYTDAELVRLAQQAGVADATVRSDGGGQLLTGHV